jgi:hypothetical protein
MSMAALVMGDHAAHEIDIGVTGIVDHHVVMHFRHRRHVGLGGGAILHGGGCRASDKQAGDARCRDLDLRHRRKLLLKVLILGARKDDKRLMSHAGSSI